jgi:probable phosphoglycerate mutase
MNYESTLVRGGPGKLPPLLLVRHAQAEHLVSDLTGGWTDSELTEIGIRQGRLLARRLAAEIAQYRERGPAGLDDQPVYLVSGSLRRSRHTAGIIANALGIEPQVHPALNDLNTGIAAGMTERQAQQVSIPPSEPLVDWRPYPEAESWRELSRRVRGFMNAFYRELKGPAVLVSHAAPIEIIIEWWLGIGLKSKVSFDVAPASLSVLRVNVWGERSVERLNDTAHLYAAGLAEPLQI